MSRMMGPPSNLTELYSLVRMMGPPSNLTELYSLMPTMHVLFHATLAAHYEVTAGGDSVGTREDHQSEAVAAQILQMGSIAYHVVAPVIISFGILSNVLNLIVLSRPSLRGPTFRYLKWLAVANLSVCVILLPFTLHTHARPVPYLAAFYFAHIEVPLGNALIASSVYIVVGLSIDRFVAVCYPRKYRNLYNHYVATVRIAMSFVVAFIIYIPMTFSKTVAPASSTLYVPKDNMEVRNNRIFMAYAYLLEACARIAPALLLAVLNIWIIVEFKKVSRRRNLLSKGTELTEMTVCSPSVNNGSFLARQQLKREGTLGERYQEVPRNAEEEGQPSSHHHSHDQCLDEEVNQYEYFEKSKLVMYSSNKIKYTDSCGSNNPKNHDLCNSQNLDAIKTGNDDLKAQLDTNADPHLTGILGFHSPTEENCSSRLLSRNFNREKSKRHPVKGRDGSTATNYTAEKTDIPTATANGDEDIAFIALKEPSRAAASCACRKSDRRHDRERRLVVLLVSIIIAFFVTNVPSAVLSVTYSDAYRNHLCFQIFRAVANNLEFLNFGLSFVLYFLFSHDIRSVFVAVLKRSVKTAGEAMSRGSSNLSANL